LGGTTKIGSLLFFVTLSKVAKASTLSSVAIANVFISKLRQPLGCILQCLFDKTFDVANNTKE
jgi:hypothetical protein